MTTSSRMKPCTEAEFVNEIARVVNTGVEVHCDIVRICEPPLRQYNDFSDGKVWPESVFASCYADGTGNFRIRSAGTASS